MPTTVQFRRGTTAQNNNFTGASGELSVDTTLNVVRVHDGATVGGFQLIGNTAAQTLTNKTLTSPVLSAPSITGGILNADANGVGNIGNSTIYFNTAFVKATSAQYADLAENYVADAVYPPGTVLIFGGNKEVTISNESHSTKIAGVVSTNPSFVMNSCQQGEHVVQVGLLGRVPCQVKGNIAKGDLLVASTVPGVAEKLENYQPGCIVGKALNTWSSDDIGTIEVVVGRL